MWKDPIVEEIHEIRERIARENDYSLEAIFRSMREREIAYPGPVLCSADLEAETPPVPSPVDGRKDAAEAR